MPSKYQRRKPTASTPRGASAALGDLRVEIDLLRVTIQEVRARTADPDAMSLNELLKALDILSRSAARLAQVLEAQRSLDESGGPLAELTQAFEAVLRENNLD